eukprot:CAMPEP_0115340634 /NCGR_PEP_ID=MMETSP0270-20121206/91248_1 /TAXON_ID=71861 /ORGANISM="Scrippsiella trochoidea, Strain CCMP3099" /LENGTH=119 /DNA_ID=CAMNT_0002762095 /DNA_START=1536 /DNA_END=1896 /DNA_ORIENTATION=+
MHPSLPRLEAKKPSSCGVKWTSLETVLESAALDLLRSAPKWPQIVGGDVPARAAWNIDSNVEEGALVPPVPVYLEWDQACETVRHEVAVRKHRPPDQSVPLYLVVVPNGEFHATAKRVL